MGSKSEIYITPRLEEIAVAGLVGAGLGLAAVSPFVTGLPGYLLRDAHTLSGAIRVVLAWAGPIAGAIAAGWYGAYQPMDSHLDGMRYVPRYAEARHALQRIECARFADPLPWVRHQTPPGLRIGGVEISHKRETTHFQAIGQTGQGKTTLYNAIVTQALARGGRVVLFDIKGDLVSRYAERPDCRLVGLWDARAALWDGPADFADPTALTDFAKKVMEVEAIKNGKGDPHWVEGAAAVLGGLLRSYMRNGGTWRWADLQADLQGGLLALVQKAARGSSEVRLRFPHAFLPRIDALHGPFLDKEESSMARSITDGVSGWLEELAIIDTQDKGRERFSFERWLTGKAHGDVHIVIFNYSKKYQTQCRRVFGAMFSVMAAVMGSPLMPKADPAAPGTWFILDEVIQLGRGSLPAIRSIMELGRDKGARVLLAFQSASQLADALGQEGARALLDQAVTPIYLHPSTRAAGEICDALKTRTVERLESTSTQGAIQGKAKHAMTVPVLLTSDLESLGEVDGGIELILQCKDVLGRLVQPFSPKPEHEAPGLVESETWKWGALRALEDADKRRAAEEGAKATAAATPAPAPAPATEPAAEPIAVGDLPDLDGDDDDVPFDLDSPAGDKE